MNDAVAYVMLFVLAFLLTPFALIYILTGFKDEEDPKEES